MPRMNRWIEAIWGYGWEREIKRSEILALIDHLPSDLSKAKRNAASTVLLELIDGGFSLDLRREGVKICREHLSPMMVGINQVKLEFTKEPPYLTGEVARMFKMPPKQLRRLVARAANGNVDVNVPARSTGRLGSKRGWYVWDREDVEHWHKALLNGEFNAWRDNCGSATGRNE